MESNDLLNIDDELHMFCLNYVFQKRIDVAIQKFKDAWNNHPLSTESNKSPNQLWVQGIATARFEPEADDVDMEVRITFHACVHSTH